MSKRTVAARALVGLVGAMTAGGALAADALVPETARRHLRNPRWPGHAKFHDAQYIVMSMLLGGYSLRLVTRRRGDPDRNLLAAAAISSTPWLGMYGAAAFPGTELVDEEFDTPKVLGLDPNIFVATSCLAVLGTAVGLARSAR
ncbi:hypothetical protein LQ327_19755 [Actinomycetospora endophytica]|uniref:Uncharacterized protein n=1 Tax=Actinomycetospora endophytica TaxID=2291215 RepID=A0ABS8PF17_9PSEU|nr:DUF6640 family protein [Actinomycetospora endophytica]MCD2195609.1 hypothetical protein [Actinomycetospora endophytica]